MGKPAGKYRNHHSLGWRWEVDARQPLAWADGCRALSIRTASFWLVLLQTGDE